MWRLLCSCHLSYPFITEKAPPEAQLANCSKWIAKPVTKNDLLRLNYTTGNYITWIIYNVKGHRSMDAFQIRHPSSWRVWLYVVGFYIIERSLGVGLIMRLQHPPHRSQLFSSELFPKWTVFVHSIYPCTQQQQLERERRFY